MKHCLLTIFSIFISILSFGQKNDYLPPTPTVAALGKYVDVPVSLSSGTPEISIPIYEINVDGFTLPISLSYHAGGFRVEEEASWVGLGWSLNGTGVISRTIRHQSDNPASRPPFFDTYTGNVLNSTLHSDYVNLTMMADKEAVDGLPDLYTFNIPGNSGKFIYLNGVKMLPKKPLLISKVNNGWSIKDERGNTFYFVGKVERTKTRASSSIQSEDISWYLSKIELLTGKEITFEYKDTEFYQSVNLSESESYKQLNPTGNFQSQGPSTNAFVTTLYGKELSKIKFPNGEVEFISEYNRSDISKPVGSVGALQLRAINVKDIDGNILKFYTLSQDYFNSSGGNTPEEKRLKFLAIEEDLESKSYSFEYNTGVTLPPKNSKAQDHWGYYNGKNNNTSLLPPFKLGSYSQVQPTRETDPAFVQACLLTKVIYPTRGYVQYEYESNDYSFTRLGQIPTEYAKVNVIDYVLGVDAWSNRSDQVPTSQVTKSGYFHVPVAQAVRINVDIEFPEGGVVGSQSQLKVELAHGEEGDPETVIATYVDMDNGDNYIDLQPGRYKITAVSTMHLGLAHATVHYQNFDLEPVYRKFCGGARVKKITEHDGIANASVRRITYHSQLDASISSGSVLETPYYLNWTTMFEAPPAQEGSGLPVIWCHYFELSILHVTSQSTYGLGQGNHIGYKEVQVYHGEEGENGMSISTFSWEPNPSPGTESDVSWRRGQMLTKTDYDNAGNKLRLQKNEYDITGLEYSYGLMVNSIGKHPCAQDNQINPSYPWYFKQTESILPSELYFLKKQIIEEYSGNNKVITTQEFFYDNIIHLQQTRSINTVNNKRLVTSLSYPDDFPNSTGFIHDLKTAHDIVPIEKVVWQENLMGANRAVLSAELFIYKAGGRGLLEEVKQLELATPLSFNNFNFANKTIGVEPFSGESTDFSPFDGYTHKASYTYNDKFKPVQITPSTGITTSFIWGYRDQFPIAKVVHALSTQVAFTGFENDNEGNWDSYISNSSDARAGKKAFVGSLSKSDLPAGQYNVSVWVKGGTGTPSISGQPANAIGHLTQGWNLFTWKLDLAGQLVINSNGSTIDDVRVHPVNSFMTSLNFDLLKGPVSITDHNNIDVRYQYDPAGRLKTINDDRGNILTKYEYQYKH